MTTRDTALAAWREIAKNGAASPASQEFIQRVAGQLVAIEDERKAKGRKKSSVATGAMRAQTIVNAVGLGGRPDKYSRLIEELRWVDEQGYGLTARKKVDLLRLLGDVELPADDKRAIELIRTAKKIAKKSR